ncbi:unnamed protein product [Phytophthora fragariaefolia]|uniref:Unnamed protein product n=1 Tax=Phytophthora fragariaefolia TaxID=1490495 RepID=A0A9W6Y0M5_9STRA|nr:unnamed protein product [Phytophthora fragariaefolia]
MSSDSDEESGLRSGSDDDEVRAQKAPVKRKRGGSEPGKAANLDHDFQAAHLRLWNDYFCEKPTYPEKLFRRRNRMSRALFERLMGAVVERDADFEQRVDAVGKKGLTPLQKCSAAVRMLVYGCAADSLDDVVKGAESTLVAYTNKFSDIVLGAMKALVTPRSQLVVLGSNTLPEVVAFWSVDGMPSFEITNQALASALSSPWSQFGPRSVAFPPSFAGGILFFAS